MARVRTEVKARSICDAGGLDQLAALLRLSLALRGEINVHPTGEAVFQVPLALAVTQQDQGGQGGHSFEGGTGRLEH